MATEDPPPRTVSYPYLRNMMGMSVDEDSMKVVPHAQAELYLHVATKFSEAFAIIGGVGGAAVGALRGRVTPGAGFLKGARNGMLLGVPVGILVLYGRMNSLKKKEDVDMDYAYFDRSYRLRHNCGQVRVDRTAYAGFGVGAVAAAATGAGALSGGAAGLVAGTVTAAVYNNFIVKS